MPKLAPIIVDGECFLTSLSRRQLLREITDYDGDVRTRTRFLVKVLENLSLPPPPPQKEPYLIVASPKAEWGVGKGREEELEREEEELEVVEVGERGGREERSFLSSSSRPTCKQAKGKRRGGGGKAKMWRRLWK